MLLTGGSGNPICPIPKTLQNRLDSLVKLLMGSIMGVERSEMAVIERFAFVGLYRSFIINVWQVAGMNESTRTTTT